MIPVIWHVIPVVLPPAQVPAAQTWTSRNVVLIDNTTLGLWRREAERCGWQYGTMNRNLGVATSWNLGARWAFTHGADVVSLVSSSVYWQDGLHAWTAAVQQHCDEYGCLSDQSFHACAWTRRTFDLIGWFDENFYPAYEEDIDWLRRCELGRIHMPGRELPKVPLKGQVVCEDAMALKHGVVHVDFARQARYYAAKWGGPKDAETFRKPFNMPVPLSYWPVLRDF